MFKKTIIRLVYLLIIVALVGGVVQYIRPVEALQPTITKPPTGGSEPLPITWPAYGQSAIGADGLGLLDTKGTQTPVPIASITKVITSLAILDKYPIKEGSGAVITLTANDVKLYNDYLAKDGSVTKVVTGEQISQYEALQAVLLPSANNLAASLAIWAFGSVDDYVTYANQMLAKMGLSQTHVADASGFSPQSVSTASDLVKLGQAALDNKTIAEIVAQRQSNIPVAGTIYNVNYLLGTSGIIGIKTGNTNEAGGCYLFAAEKEIDGKPVKIIGSVLGAPNLSRAINDSLPFLESASKNFEYKTVVKSGQTVASYLVPWSSPVEVVASNDLPILTWKGEAVKVDIQLKSVKAPLASGSDVGSLKVSSAQEVVNQKLVTKENIPKPTIWWKITRF